MHRLPTSPRTSGAVIEHRPIRARPASLAYLLGKLVQRNRWKTVAATAAVVGAVAVLGALLSWKLARSESSHRRTAETAQREAEIATYGASIGAAEIALQLGDPTTARRILDDVTRENLRRWEWRHLRQRVDQSQWATVLPEPIAQASFDPSGRYHRADDG